MKKLIFLVILIISIINKTCAAPSLRYCVEFVGISSSKPTPMLEDLDDDDNSDYSSDTDIGMESSNNTLKAGKVACDSNVGSCFTVWTVTENGTVHLIRQGCWQSQNSCSTECIGSNRNSEQQIHQFCCCIGDMCNANFTSAPLEPEEAQEVQDENLLLLYSPALWICSSISIIVILSIIIFVACRMTSNSEPELAPLAPSGPGYSSNLHNVDNLKLCAMIGQGKYGTVWKGMINEQPVAVKIFPGQYKQYFLNERDIYTTPLMDSPSLLSYFGCDQRRTMDDNIEYLLVLSLAPLGCLQDWLVDNTTSFQTFYKMAKSIARGVSHLHTQITKGDTLKPCICHRDLNSRNILVKSDLSCCIGDFGFALKAFGPRYEYKGEMTLAETKSINEVGTLRYMAPEILEGAVNLRDCESALKQIDVYALGLIVWELCTRCHDFYAAGQNTPNYKAPYEAETGKNPTFEQMQVLVSRHKARPTFPAEWGGGPASKIAKETCEDCWDHDAEARLTALCVEERLNEIATYRPKLNLSRATSPQLSTNSLLPVVSSQLISTSPNKNGNILVFTPNTINLITAPPNQIIPNGFSNKISENTGDTFLSYSSDDVVVTTVKNKELFSQHIQQYHAKNPYIDQHLAQNISNESQRGIDKSRKHSFINIEGEGQLDNFKNQISVEDLLATTSRNLEITQSESNLGEGFNQKQNNIDKKLKGWHGVRALIQNKLFKRNNEFEINENDDKSNLVDSNKINETISNTTPTKNTRVDLIENLNKKTQNGCVRTKVDPTNLSNGAVIFNNQTQRPNNLNIKYSYNDNNSISPIKVNGFKSLPNGQTFTVIKSPNHNISKNLNNKIIHTSPRIVVSKSANAVKNLNNNLDHLNEKQIKRQRSLEVFREVFNSKGSCERLRDPSQRVKTPGDVPPSVRKVRASKTLSLYDDRMMDTSGGNTL